MDSKSDDVTGQTAVQRASGETLAIFSVSPFERAVRCIKFYEGWHTKKDYPYCGWGHRIAAGENIHYPLSVAQADYLLRTDLIRLYKMFLPYGKYALLLAVLAYNVGPYKILGNNKYAESELIKKIKRGDDNIIDEYLSFCHWKGRFIPSIRRRRMTELRLLLYDGEYRGRD